MALPHGRRIEFHFDIRRDAVVLHVHGPLGFQIATLGAITTPPSISSRISDQAHQPAPGALADQLADARAAEIPGHGVAARAGEFD